MVESLVIILDNSEYMRNGDFFPTRLEAQLEAANFIARARLQAPGKNRVGLCATGGRCVRHNLTGSLGSFMSASAKVQHEQKTDVITSLKTAQLVLKSRQEKGTAQRILLFVGSPLNLKEAAFKKLAGKFKKNEIQVDVVNFGDLKTMENNEAALKFFVDKLNHKSKKAIKSKYIAVQPGAFVSLPNIIFSKMQEDQPAPSSTPQSAPGGDKGDPENDPLMQAVLQESMKEFEKEQQRKLAEKDGVPNNGGQQPEVAPQAENQAEPADPKAMEIEEEEESEYEEEEHHRAMAMSLMDEEGESGEADQNKEENVEEVLEDREFLEELIEQIGGEIDVEDLLQDEDQDQDGEEEPKD